MRSSRRDLTIPTSRRSGSGRGGWSGGGFAFLVLGFLRSFVFEFLGSWVLGFLLDFGVSTALDDHEFVSIRIPFKWPLGCARRPWVSDFNSLYKILHNLLIYCELCSHKHVLRTAWRRWFVATAHLRNTLSLDISPLRECPHPPHPIPKT